MKKILTAIALVASISTAGAANYVELGYENANATPSSRDGAAQTIRVSKDVGGINLGLQAKVRTIEAGGIKSSVEANVGNEFKLPGIIVKPFVGIGHDYGTGKNSTGFEYGLVGIKAGTKINVFNVGVLVKQRLNWDSTAPEQTVVGAFVGYPSLTFKYNPGYPGFIFDQL